MRSMRSSSLLLVLLLPLLPGTGGPASAAEPPAGLVAPLGASPLEPATTGGVEVVDRALAKLATHRRLLVVGAHPDDEDTSALTLVSRGQGGESAYFSLSRGEGGQNLIGPELGVDLGLIRSRELLAARGVDGGRQYFSRGYDFGYTRSLEETFEKWPKRVLLEDAVRVIRRFRPQVVVSVFPGDARGGHGQHQAAGVVAHEAFELAADPEAFPELSDPAWAPASLFRATWWDRDSTTLTTELGGLDPLAGRTHFQIAMASRSQHRSQDMGRVLPLGPRRGRYAWVAGPGGEGSDDLFAGVDTRLEAIAELLPAGPLRASVFPALAQARTVAEEARLHLTANAPGQAVPALERIRLLLRTALEQVRERAGDAPEVRGTAAVEALLAEKLGVADRGLLAATGLALDAWSEESAVAPGEEIPVEAEVYHGGRPAADGEGPAVELVGIELAAPSPTAAPGAGAAAWTVRTVEPEGGEDEDGDGPVLRQPGPLAPGALARRSFAVAPAADATPTVPYFLARPPSFLQMGGTSMGGASRADLQEGGTSPGGTSPGAPGAEWIYDWSGAPAWVRGEPFGPPPLVARFTLRIGEEELTVEREVVQRVSDQAVGEVRRPLRVVPLLEVAVEPELVVWSTAEEGAGRPGRSVRVTLRSHAGRPLAGSVRLELPEGWSAGAPALPFEIAAAGGETAVELELPVPDDLPRGHHHLGVVAELEGGATFRAAFPLVDYPHIRATPSPREAGVEVAAADIRLPGLSAVGYVLGASDRVPADLAAVGVPVETLTGRDLAQATTEELARFDAIVVGSRAYETDADLADPATGANAGLLEYARAGGLVIVEYQQYQFVRGGYAPRPLDIARPHDRVTDELAPATVLAPEHPVFHTPNEIGPADWQGWVQERGLYFAHQWDDLYRPLLSFPNDRAEGPEAPDAALRGGLLVAPVGEGTYVYTGLAFFRQLPAGVTGAYRLFANLLALARDGRPGAVP